MPRAKRICFPGAIYHVIQRGNRKQSIFIDDFDRWHLLKLFLEAKKRFAFNLHCYALMANHFHMTIETPNSTPISKIMQLITGSYAIYFNTRHSNSGHLFQGRFKDIVVEKEKYLLNLSRYVHLNPVRAGMARLPEHYKWSSYNVYLGLRKDILVDCNFILNCFDEYEEKKAREKYKNFIEEGIFEYSREDWLQKNLKNKRFLSSTDFIRQIKKV